MKKYEVAVYRVRDFVRNIKDYFHQEGLEVIYNKRNIIKVIPFEQDKYVVKAFKVPHFMNRIAYRFFRDSKAKRSFENAKRLQMIGIATPQPIGYIEFPGRFLFKESFYISAYFAFDFEIRAVLSDKAFPHREEILKAFMVFTYKLHQKNVYHLDYSPGNILVKKESGSYLFSIIDVNRMQFINMGQALRMESLAKLTSDEEDNQIMVTYYAQISGEKPEVLSAHLNRALAAQQRYLERKRRWKRLFKRER